MSWMSKSFKEDKRYLELQLKRGQIKRKDVEKVLSNLPDVSQKAMVMGKPEKTGEEKTPDGEK